MTEPKWANVHYPKPDFENIIYYSAPKAKDKPKSLDDIDPEMRKKPLKDWGFLLLSRKRLTVFAVDAVMDSVSVGTTFKKQLGELGIIFCSFSESR